MTPREEANQSNFLLSMVTGVASLAVVLTAPIWGTALIVKGALEKDKEKK